MMHRDPAGLSQTKIAKKSGAKDRASISQFEDRATICLCFSSMPAWPQAQRMP